MKHELILSSDVVVEYRGMNLSAGPLPALFYFSLSAHDSLFLDPFNQPVEYLSSLPLRIFSMTLPGHEDQLPPTQALNMWAKKIAHGENVLEHFIQKTVFAINALIEKQIVLGDKVAVAGLSRGAFIATHVAAKCSIVKWILGFAPLTKLSSAKEFETMQDNPIVNALNLEHSIDALTERSLRFYIGNCDTRVSTRRCFDFIDKLSQAAHKKRIRSPEVELIISPSIGHQGHGTPKEIFQAGAQWIAEKMGVIDVL